MSDTKCRLVALIFMVAFAAPACAGGSDHASGTLVLGEDNRPRPAADDTCVEIEIGGEKTSHLDCLNQQLKQQVDHVQPVGNVAPIDAMSPAVKSHGFNETALQQQYGRNLGKSVLPFRPNNQSH